MIDKSSFQPATSFSQGNGRIGFPRRAKHGASGGFVRMSDKDQQEGLDPVVLEALPEWLSGRPPGEEKRTPPLCIVLSEHPRGPSIAIQRCSRTSGTGVPSDSRRRDNSLTATPSDRESAEIPSAAGLASVDELTTRRLNPTRHNAAGTVHSYTPRAPHERTRREFC